MNLCKFAFTPQPDRSMQQTGEALSKPKLILLDVYETLLDMSDIERKVNNLLDSKRGYDLWFALFMQYCFVDNFLGSFNRFSSIAHATMKMASKKLDKVVSEQDIDGILELMKHLPLHEDVHEGLSLLYDRSFRIAALTNSSEAIIAERMERTGLISYFESVLSAEHVKKYKPAIEVYQWAAQKLDVPMQDILLISSHGWDIAGAGNAGMQTAYIQRDREILYPLVKAPDYVAKNLPELANQLI